MGTAIQSGGNGLSSLPTSVVGGTPTTISFSAPVSTISTGVLGGGMTVTEDTPFSEDPSATVATDAFTTVFPTAFPSVSVTDLPICEVPWVSGTYAGIPSASASVTTGDVGSQNLKAEVKTGAATTLVNTGSVAGLAASVVAGFS
ncbi:unnamed protein product [Cyclocybe aegerita]|uniref:Uncharacterized protein n=1 Tax=Cyclocybe aegerita TaxID=1973307 RepID=A0A8S0X0X3_CYCAE|nr:unnamed protein product [Cyclocybe aegerita]